MKDIDYPYMHSAKIADSSVSLWIIYIWNWNWYIYIYVSIIVSIIFRMIRTIIEVSSINYACKYWEYNDNMQLWLSTDRHLIVSFDRHQYLNVLYDA